MNVLIQRIPMQFSTKSRRKCDTCKYFRKNQQIFAQIAKISAPRLRTPHLIAERHSRAEWKIESGDTEFYMANSFQVL